MPNLKYTGSFFMWREILKAAKSLMVLSIHFRNCQIFFRTKFLWISILKRRVKFHLGSVSFVPHTALPMSNIKGLRLFFMSILEHSWQRLSPSTEYPTRQILVSMLQCLGNLIKKDDVLTSPNLFHSKVSDLIHGPFNFSGQLSLPLCSDVWNALVFSHPKDVSRCSYVLSSSLFLSIITFY